MTSGQIKTVLAGRYPETLKRIISAHIDGNDCIGKFMSTEEAEYWKFQAYKLEEVAVLPYKDMKYYRISWS